MTLVYRDNIGMVKVELSKNDSVAFFEGYVYATTADNEFLKLKTEDLLYIE